MRHARSYFGFLTLALCLLFGAFWWHQQLTHPPLEGSVSSSSLQGTAPQDGVSLLLDSLHQEIEQNGLTPENCKPKLTDFFNRAMALKVEDFNPIEMHADGHGILKRTFTEHLRLRELLTRWESDGGPLSDPSKPGAQECVWSFRRAFRGLRVMADYVSEAAEGFPYDSRMMTVAGKEEPVERVVPAFLGGPNYLLWNEKFGQDGQAYVPRSGDVLLSRGTASTSAAIARITDEDANFSHLSIVYVDPATGIAQTIEAHIEIGSHVFDWATYIGDKKARAVVFRYRDPEVAHKAASAIRDHVANYIKKKGKSICYDFGMQLANHDCIFCSEIVGMAFEKVGISLPFYQSTMVPKNRRFLDSFGVTASKTFAPADIELDPRFDLVAEWRDIGRIHTTHQMDASLTAMFKWMDEQNYALHPDLHDKAKSWLGYLLRRIPLLDRTVDHLFPTNMSSKMIATELALNDVVMAMTTYLDDTEKVLPRTPKRLTPTEMYLALDQFRRAQLAQRRDGRDRGVEKLPEKYDYSALFHP